MAPLLPQELDPERLQAVVDLWRTAGKRIEIPVAGESMFPVLRPGWMLVLDHAPSRHPFGSVIVFLQGRLLVAHRVVGRRRGAYLTKGDALLHFDRETVSPERILGRVVAVRRPDGGNRPEGALRRLAGRGLGVVSRCVGEVHRLTRPIAGRAPGPFPGPTRILAALNRAVVGLAGRLLAPRDQSPGPPPSSGNGAPGGTS